MDFSKIKTWTIGGKEVKTLEVNGQVYWKKEEVPPVECKAFYVEDASGSANSLTLKKTGQAPTIKLEYSTNGSTWQEWANCQTTALPISPNSKVFLRGTNNNFGVKYDTYNTFTCSGSFNIGGDITTLLEPNGNVLDLSGRDGSFYNLFKDSKVIDISNLVLPSTTLSASCYVEMFQNCSLITTAPELPATNLANDCYSWMFAGCTSLVNAPKVLPATILKDWCYNSMFKGCTSLVNTPEIYGQPSVNHCITGVFQNCSKVNSIKVRAITWDNYVAQNWVEGVSPTGTFSKPKELIVGNGYNGTIPTGRNGIPSGWTVEDVDFTNYFYVEDASGSDNSLTLTKDNSNAPDIKLEYSTDKQVWNSWAEPYTTPLPIKANSKVFLRGTNNSFSLDYNANKFNCTKVYNVGGDITTLIEPNGEVLDLRGRNNCFVYLFVDSATLKNASQLILPSNLLSNYCYCRMFYSCSSLVTTPKVLPATTLASNCYQYMFYNCSSLTQAPTLPAKTLANGCYGSMFGSCSSLETAPELPATILANRCYSGMFRSCTSLNKVEVGATTWNETNTNLWVLGVSPTGTFTKPKGVDIPTGTNGIPDGWTIVEV